MIDSLCHRTNAAPPRGPQSPWHQFVIQHQRLSQMLRYIISSSPFFFVKEVLCPGLSSQSYTLSTLYLELGETFLTMKAVNTFLIASSLLSFGGADSELSSLRGNRALGNFAPHTGNYATDSGSLWGGSGTEGWDGRQKANAEFSHDDGITTYTYSQQGGQSLSAGGNNNKSAKGYKYDCNKGSKGKNKGNKGSKGGSGGSWPGRQLWGGSNGGGSNKGGKNGPCYEPPLSGIGNRL